MIPAKEAMQRLVGHRFPGGQYRIEHWENFLLSEATGIEPLPDALAHPVHLFHVPINGVGTSIAELFRLAEVDRTSHRSASTTTIGRFTHRFAKGKPTRFRVESTAYERTERDGRPDRPIRSRTKSMYAGEDGNLAAQVAFRWHYWRFDS